MASLFAEVDRLSKLDSKESLADKKIYCCALTGFSGETVDQLHKWNRNIKPYGKIDIVMKPQYLHSAMAIYVLLKYPQYRPINSFVNMIIQNKGEATCLKIAIDVLQEDPDGANFVLNSDALLNSKDMNIVDEHNNKVVSNN
jgi:hypothetical protein